VPNVTRVYLFWWGPSFLSVSCVQCYPCLSFLVECVSSCCVLCPMIPVYIFFDGVRVFFLCLVCNDIGVYLSVSCVQCYPCQSFLVGFVSSFCVLCPMLPVYIFFGGVRVYLSVSCVQCYPCLSFLVGFVSSFCVLCPMLPVSIFFGGVHVFFLFLVSNVSRIYIFRWSVCLLSVSCVQCSPCLSFLVGPCLLSVSYVQ
jgi:hypothetical protein